MKTISVKRVYEDKSKDDGYRVFIDRLWPRGVSKEDAHFDEWMKELAPSTKLRKWFDHKSERFEEFSLRYRLELGEKELQLNVLRQIAKQKTLTLLYAAKDPKVNHAVVLRKVLFKET